MKDGNEITGKVVIRCCMRCGEDLRPRLTMEGERAGLGIVWCADCGEKLKAKDKLLRGMALATRTLLGTSGFSHMAQELEELMREAFPEV